MNNERYHKPLYSPDRYNNEIELQRKKKEQLEMRKIKEDRVREMLEYEEISKYFIPEPGAKLNKEEFLKKYEQQVKIWEARKKGTLPNKSNEDESINFKPVINKRSMEITKDLEKITERIGKLKENKKKKIEDMLKEMKPSFTPRINKSSVRMVNESRSRASSYSSNISARDLQKI